MFLEYAGWDTTNIERLVENEGFDYMTTLPIYRYRYSESLTTVLPPITPGCYSSTCEAFIFISVGKANACRECFANSVDGGVTRPRYFQERSRRGYGILC